MSEGIRWFQLELYAVDEGERPVHRAPVRHHDSPPELTDAECEGAALALLARVSADRRLTPLAPSVLARALNLGLSPTAPSGCRGVLDLNTWRLRYDGRGAPETVSERLAHELGHYAAARAGHAGRHPEASVDRVAMALALPRSAVRAALSRVGFDPERLVIELPGVSAPWAIVRAAWVAGRSVIVRVGSERWAYAPEDLHGTLAESAWERELVLTVLRTGRSHRDLFGSVARPLVVAGRTGVVILPAG